MRIRDAEVMTNHADEEPWLLRSAAHTSITDNTNCEARRETGQTYRQTGAELYETLE